MRYVDSPIDCLLTPVKRVISPPHLLDHIDDEFIETPWGEGSSTRLARETIQPDWDTIDTDLNYLEAMSKRFGKEPPTGIKLSYDRMLGSLVQIERSLQLNQQFGDLPEVDLRKDRLYRTKEYRLQPISPEDSTGPAVKGVESLNPPDISQETGPLADRGECGRTRVYSNAASHVVDPKLKDGQLTA